MSLSFINKIQECVQFIQERMQVQPVAGMITGTGLSDSLTDLVVHQVFPYAGLPHFPRATVDSHKGALVQGRLNGRDILVFQGRLHLYEGYSPQLVTFPVRLLQALGVPMLILTNAAGGINLDYHAGDIMLIRDHINLTGENPLAGPNEDAFGLRFPDMTRVYDPDLGRRAIGVAAQENIQLHSGIYAGLSGPSLETPAETRFLKIIGADAVGFSTVMEAIAGVHADMKILGLSLITNINDPDAPEQTTLEAVVDTAAKASEKLNRIITGVVEQPV
ncbi:purine-nucleoside phosphorylase [Desulfobacter latus]|uniref:Purine nucleoside phosphorylase n=1 Tax=Desulfobacter latus TaxID=2292 RepID=A0A850T4C9_9BACT|nr:purine-nucleoside phosphorylase [Desulfobacter latus]NWH05941.1 purine-nucleoside phosphorylase [Desulfobacter latus]